MINGGTGQMARSDQDIWVKYRQSAFTIVELLIVIVVIAILATISIVAYRGIQQRANDTRRTSDIAAIAKALDLYYVTENQYPASISPT
jgi:general secretion pathway protein G